MTDNPQTSGRMTDSTDPRAKAIHEVICPVMRQPHFDECYGLADVILQRIDAADEAAGVRRVTAEEREGLQREARQAALREAADEVRVEARWQAEYQRDHPSRPLRRAYFIERLLLVEEILLSRASGLLAADSPVGGVS